MKRYLPQTVRPPRHIRVPAFLPVPLRARRDGWTPQRQAAFLVALAASRSVVAAARKVGMARESVYQLRRHAGGESFAAAWDGVLEVGGAFRKITSEERLRAALEGRIKPVIWRGECVGTVLKTDDSAFLGLLKRATRSDAR